MGGMVLGLGKRMAGWSLVVGLGAAAAAAQTAEPEHHRKGYKPLPQLAVVTVHVEKRFNGKPLENAAVVFHATRNGDDDGNLEVKTDPDGVAKIDLLEVGSEVTMQVIADGYATYATAFPLDGPLKEMTVRMERPRAQISAYEDNTDRASVRPLGVQEPPHNVKVQGSGAPTSGSFSGTVWDKAGARIPGAIVKVQQLAVQPPVGTASTPGAPSASGISLGDNTTQAPPTANLLTATAFSDSSGIFHKRGLPAGHYRVEISAPGFLPMVYPDVRLTVGDDHNFDKPLMADPAAGQP